MKTTLIKLAVLAIAACGTLLVSRPAMAADVPATLTITAVRDLSLSSSSINFGTATLAQFEAGYSSEQTLTATIKSNTSWTLKVKGSSTTWSATGGGWASKPRSDIEFKSVSGDANTYAALSGTDVQVHSGGATTTSGATKDVKFRVKLDFANDSPDTYTYQNVVITLGS